MGTAKEQGQLWGARAADWASCSEPRWKDVFGAVLDLSEVKDGVAYLDIGCGAGGALVLAQRRGAIVTGLDGSENLIAIARERLPGSELQVGEMEALPFDDQRFDAVTGINSFQFAGDIGQALREARRVCKPGGRVTMLAWGRREACDILSRVMPAVFALLPASSGPPPLPLAEPGFIEGIMEKAGLAAARASDIDGSLTFPSKDIAVRACLSAAARAIAHAGEERVRTALEESLEPFVGAGGEVKLVNRFRAVTASPRA